MIVSSEIRLFVCLLTALSAFASRCPENVACDCERNRNDDSLEIHCLTKNSTFVVKFQPNDRIKVRDCKIRRDFVSRSKTQVKAKLIRILSLSLIDR